MDSLHTLVNNSNNQNHQATHLRTWSLLTYPVVRDDLNVFGDALLVAPPEEVIEQTLVVCYTVGVDFPSLINVMK